MNARRPAAAPSQVRIARHSRFRLVAALLAVLLPLVLITAVGIGPVRITPMHVLAALIGNPQALAPEERVIVLSVRLPRILAAACTGAALSVAGVLFQGLFRNPLADPYVIGSSSGSVLGAAVAVFLLPETLTYTGFGATSLCAFAGAALTVGCVYLLGRVRGQSSTVTLLLAGFALGTMLNSGAYLIEVVGGESSAGMRALAAWLHGSISIPEWRQLGIVSALMILGMAAAWLLMPRLNTLALGEDYATQLGLHVERTRIAIIAVAALLTATAVTLGGLISFVGLIVPHLMRMLVGPDNSRLLPVAAAGGAIFLVLTDTLARTVVAPMELPVGILMAFVGGPFFLYMLRRGGNGYAL